MKKIYCEFGVVFHPKFPRLREIKSLDADDSFRLNPSATKSVRTVVLFVLTIKLRCVYPKRIPDEIILLSLSPVIA